MAAADRPPVPGPWLRPGGGPRRRRPCPGAAARPAVRATAGAVRRVIGLVWAASRWLTFGLATATVLAGIIPAITAYVAKLLIDAVVRAIQVQANPALPPEVAFGPWLVNV